MKKKYILALDQGTSSSRAMLIDHAGVPCGIEQQEFEQIYPQPGWVEHAPEDIWSSQMSVVHKLFRNSGVQATEIAAIGITNQRETTVLWDRFTGEPVANAIVWQDRRTASHCRMLENSGHAEPFRNKTGLPLDPYFSATKICWLLRNIPFLRGRAENGDIAFGTVDSFLLWRLTNGRVHATDVSNASRTMLYNIFDLKWDSEIISILDIPDSLLPEVRQSSGYFGETDPPLFGVSIPIFGMAGDQQSATYGQACHREGMAKNTYGTGCFLLMNTGETPQKSSHGLLTTIAWKQEGSVTYALEGSVFSAGSAVHWLRDELQIIRSSAEIESLAVSVKDSGGVVVVPAFTGLGAPYWDPHARGAIFGLTRGAGRGEIARAVLESICFQTFDVLKAMQADSGLDLNELRVDGGMTVNNTLLQIQADILGTTVVRPAVTETTALGAAYLAGLGSGFWKDISEIDSHWKIDASFHPMISSDQRQSMLSLWKKAVDRVRNWNIDT